MSEPAGVIGRLLRYVWCSCACGRVWDQNNVEDVVTIRCICGKVPHSIIRWDSPDEDAPEPQLEDK